MNFLKGYAVWAAFTCVPPLVLYLRTHLFRETDLFFFVPFLLIPMVGCLVLWFGIRSDSAWIGGVAGLLLGIAIPIAGSFAWMKIYPGFESEPAIFLGGLMIAGPSAIGGSLAGWLRSGSGRRNITAVL